MDVLKNSQPSKSEPGANANLPPMMAPPMMPPPMISNPMVPTNPMIPGRYTTDYLIKVVVLNPDLFSRIR